jgi:hypothetical protein
MQHCRSEHGGKKAADYLPGLAALQSLEPFRNPDPVLVGRQFGGNFWIDDRPTQDLDKIEERKKEAR